MDKKLTQREVWLQLFKNCNHPLHGREVSFSMLGDVLMSHGEIVADLSKETVEVGILRMVRNRLEEKRLYAEQEKDKSDKAYARLMTDLEVVSDALASQGTSVDKDYGSDAKDVEGG